MNARYLLAVALVTAAAVAACGGPATSDLLEGDNGTERGTPETGETAPGTETPATTDPGTDTPGTLPTNSTAGKAFFVSDVHPFLESKCSSCHAAGGVGNPTWLVKADGAKTYELVYAQAYAVSNSRLVVKGIHSGGAAPELTVAEKTKFAQWIAMETADGGQKAQTNVLEKFGSCFDKAKFDAIGFGQLRTTRRTQNNNPQKQQENANTCTGCDNAPCRTCHSADDVTGFIMAIGSPTFGEDYTFEQSKRLDPAFIRQYVSTSATGEPQFNPAIKTKSVNTIEKAKAGQHPMYIMSAEMTAAVQAFVDDAVAKYKTGVCGK